MNDSTMRVVKIHAPLRHQVVEGIRNAIAMGRFGAGQRLVERDLCELMGVSRTLIREALRQLESEELVEVIPNKGPIVARISAQQAREVFQLRVELEGLASELFAKTASNEQLKGLQAAFENLKLTYANGDSAAVLTAKTAFYDRLVEGAGNETLGRVLRQLHSRAMVLRATSLSQPGRKAESEREIAELMKAIKRRDGAAARKASVAHVAKAAEAALRVIEGAEGETGHARSVG